jgi:two-component system, cell cycle response regulator DivK
MTKLIGESLIIGPAQQLNLYSSTTACGQSGVSHRAAIYCPRKPRVQAGESTPIVLLVEDDQDGRRMYADWLTIAGFRVDQAHNGLQALERAFDSRPNVVVTDLNIPGIDGFELTRRLRQDSRTRDVLVIAVTGYAAFASDPGRARRAGCDAVLPKPCSPGKLETAIRDLIRERSSQS